LITPRRERGARSLQKCTDFIFVLKTALIGGSGGGAASILKLKRTSVSVLDVQNFWPLIPPCLLFFSLSLTRSLTLLFHLQSFTYSISHAYTHTHTFSLCLYLTHTHTHAYSLTHKHTFRVISMLEILSFLSLSLSLSWSA